MSLHIHNIEMACYMYGHLASHHTEMFYVQICYKKVYDAGILENVKHCGGELEQAATMATCT